MRPRSRKKHKGRRESGTFTLIPHAVQDSANFRSCSGSAIKLLMDLARQFNGNNNGDLCAAMRVLRPRGWTRDETVGHALRELRHYGLIQLTRQGGLHQPSLFALAWLAIDECDGKLECAATRVPSGEWKQQRGRFVRPKKKTPRRKPGYGGPLSHTETGALPENAAPESGAISNETA